MKKILGLGALALMVSLPTFAGGILTNTNQHIAFLRMISRGASTGIDAAYYNPAGTAFLSDGLHLSFNAQSAYQSRIIDSHFPGQLSGLSHKYEGKAAAPLLPSVMGAYKTGKWSFSGYFGLVGGGGKAAFAEGLPMFNNKVVAGLLQKGMRPGTYCIESSLDGKQYIFGLQIGASYQITKWLSAYAGVRGNYFMGGYEGFLTASTLGNHSMELLSMKLNSKQGGWGFTPVVGLDAKLGNLNLGVKYEFITKMNITNNTKERSFKMMGHEVPLEQNPLRAYDNGVNTPNDMPALLSAAAQYSILPSLRVSGEYHYYFDKQAGMANDKQKFLSRGTREILAGIEWDINKFITISTGYQNTDYGQTEKFQQDTSFSCDSYSIGCGAAFKLNKHLTMNMGYFWTKYQDDKVNVVLGPQFGYQNTYSRANKVLGIGLDIAL